MKHTWCLLAFVCLVAGCGFAQQRTDAEAKVLALERLWGAAAEMRDEKALASIFDDSMAYVHVDGRLMTKTQVLTDTAAVSSVDIVVQSSDAHSHGSVVIVTGVMRLKGIEHGKPYLRYGRFLDTWIEKGDRWVCISSMTTPVNK